LSRFFDISEFAAVRNQQLMTPAYVEMRRNGYSRFEHFWDECISTCCNYRADPHLDGSISARIQATASWGTRLPFQLIKAHWLDFISANRDSNKRSNTLMENLVKLADAQTDIRDGVLWVELPSLSRCRELFARHSVLAVDEAALKYETIPLEDTQYWRSFHFVVDEDSSEHSLFDDEDSSELSVGWD
jgi:hypothetical protein